MVTLFYTKIHNEFFIFLGVALHYTIHLIKRKINAEEEIFYKIFSLIGKEVLGYCFQFAKDVAMEKNETIVASDYLKSDNNYYRKVIQRLWIVYNSNKELNDYINKICAK